MKIKRNGHKTRVSVEATDPPARRPRRSKSKKAKLKRRRKKGGKKPRSRRPDSHKMSPAELRRQSEAMIARRIREGPLL